MEIVKKRGDQERAVIVVIDFFVIIFVEGCLEIFDGYYIGLVWNVVDYKEYDVSVL